MSCECERAGFECGARIYVGEPGSGQWVCQKQIERRMKKRPHEFVVPTANDVPMTIRFTRETGRTVVQKRGLTVLLARWDGGPELVVLSRCGLSLADQKDVESALRIEAQS